MVLGGFRSFHILVTTYLEAYLDISSHLNRLCSDAWTTDTPSLVYELVLELPLK